MKKHILCLEVAVERCQEVMDAISAACVAVADYPALKEELDASIDALMHELLACQAEAWRSFFYSGSCTCGEH